MTDRQLSNYVTWLLFMESNVTILHYSLKKLLIMLLGYFLWKVMRYNIVLLPKKVTNYVTWLLFMESNALQYCVFRF